jgi:DNA (cytosine-5)-methyltransferase 1
MIWYESDNPNGFVTGKTFSIDQPCITLMAAGLGGDSYGHWHFRTDGRTERRFPMMNKPAFEPLTMGAVNAAPLTGLTHVSTFSGGGGSCLGFRLAGFRTLWANDLEAHARDCYRANLASPIDGRDIRQVTAADILTTIGLAAGELDVFEGSPPCTAFSTAGKRAKGWGQTKDHAGHVQRNVEDLFFDWLHLVDGLRPRAFVAENVAGLVKGVAKGYFKDILRQMKALGYRTEARVLDAQWLGVPQQRSRVIFIGLRDDLDVMLRWPAPWTYQYSVRDALPWIGRVIHDTSGLYGAGDVTDRPSPAITIGVNSINSLHFKVNDLALPPSCTPGSYGVQEINPDRPCPTVTIASPGSDLAVTIEGANGFNGHRGRSPDAVMQTVQAGRPVNVITGRVGSHFKRTDVSVERPLNTVQCSDPAQTRYEVGPDRRKFTIDELKRICSFPDDYVMSGSYAQQWARLGNSVPPLMAKAIGEAVRDALLAVAKK